jgi:phenylacetate-CoA ligase
MNTSSRDFYDEIESASADELQALQLKRMQWSLAHAYEHVPHYRKSFDALGVTPRDLRQLSDLSQFPLMTKSDMRAAYPFDLFASRLKEVVRLHASSGTTGSPVLSGHTKADLDRWTHLAARSLYAVGARADDILHMGLVYGLKTGAFPIHYGAEKLGCTVVPVSGDTAERHVQYLLDFQPRLFMSNRSQVLTILDCFDRMGKDPREAGVEIGVFGGEGGSTAMRELIADRFGLKSIEAFGLTEVCGAGMAIQTPGSGDGITIWEDHFYPEIIDAVTGKPLPDGDYGELVLTSLAKEASPIIRYRTQDITCILPPAERAMRRIAPIKGRAGEIVTVNNKILHPLDVEQELLSDPRVRPFYQIVVSNEDGHDRVSIEVEMSDELSKSGKEAQSICKKNIAACIESAMGFVVEINLALPLTFPRGSAKLVRFLDLR